MTNDRKIRVRVTHEEAIVSAGVRALLSHCTDVLLAGADDTPDVLITDYHGGLAAKGNAVPVLVLTQREKLSDVQAALAAGVCGYLLQSECAPQLQPAIRALSLGGSYLGIASDAVSSLNPRDQLTRRESDMLLLLAQGHCNKIIARELGISIGTVKTHVKGIFGKLGAKARTQAVILGARHGLVQLGEHRP